MLPPSAALTLTLSHYLLLTLSLADTHTHTHIHTQLSIVSLSLFLLLDMEKTTHLHNATKLRTEYERSSSTSLRRMRFVAFEFLHPKYGWQKVRIDVENLIPDNYEVQYDDILTALSQLESRCSPLHKSLHNLSYHRLFGPRDKRDDAKKLGDDLRPFYTHICYAIRTCFLWPCCGSGYSLLSPRQDKTNASNAWSRPMVGHLSWSSPDPEGLVLCLVGERRTSVR